jgi:glucose-6-phosphate-specific signal transduction histidine kinase
MLYVCAVRKQYISPSASACAMDYHYGWKGDLYVTSFENSIVICSGRVCARL